MNIRIAAFGSESLIEIVKQYVSHFQGVELIPYIYDTIEESVELVGRSIDVDVLLFTGSLPYMLSRNEIIKKGTPAVFIPLDEYTVLHTLFNVKYHLKCSTFSIDVLDSVNVYEIFNEVSVGIEDVYIKNLTNIYDDNGKLKNEEIIQFHEDLWNSGKIEIAVTCLSSVYKELKKKEIPVKQMIQPQKTIKDTIIQAIMHGELELSKKAQIIVGIISIDNYQALIADKGSYLAESNSLVLHQLLLDFSSEIHASLQRVGKDEFIIYGTKGSFEIVTNQYRELPVLLKMKKLLNVKVNVGFGFGLTTKEAENNAQIALQHSAENSEKNCAYIVNADKRLLGPLTQVPIDELYSMENGFEYDYLLNISNSSGINLQNIRKIVEFCKLISFQPFSAAELAEYMQISRRGAERFIKNLVNSSFARIVGEEQVSQRGRPTTLYRLTESNVESKESILTSN